VAPADVAPGAADVRDRSSRFAGVPL